MNLRKLVETSPRCIIICLAGKWAMTAVEGVHFGHLDFHRTVQDAAFAFFGKRPTLSRWERRIATRHSRLTRKKKMVWVTERAPALTKRAAGWLRHFGKLRGDLRPVDPAYAEAKWN